VRFSLRLLLVGERDGILEVHELHLVSSWTERAVGKWW
jgi:hypothetical protein